MDFAPIRDDARPLAAMIDHTILKPDATASQVERTCAEAIHYGFAAVCVLPARLGLVVRLLARSTVVPCTVAGFPLGASESATKAFEAARAAAQGAGEIDMVMAIGALKDGDLSLVEDDIAAVVRAAGTACRVKVIIETGLLTDAEKITACRLAESAGAAFVKTSTGMAGGATAADVRLMRAAVGPAVRVKASGGIRTRADAQAMVEAGAARIGTSAGVAILTAP
jgi:deoxyribose-phosphate aldolase